MVSSKSHMKVKSTHISHSCIRLKRSESLRAISLYSPVKRKVDELETNCITTLYAQRQLDQNSSLGFIIPGSKLKFKVKRKTNVVSQVKMTYVPKLQRFLTKEEFLNDMDKINKCCAKEMLELNEQATDRAILLKDPVLILIIYIL